MRDVFGTDTAEGSAHAALLTTLFEEIDSRSRGAVRGIVITADKIHVEAVAEARCLHPEGNLRWVARPPGHQP